MPTPDGQSPAFSRQVGDQQGIRPPVVLDNILCRLLGVLECSKFGLGNAKGLNELDTTMGRIDRFECWVVEKGEANNIRFAAAANGAVGRDPVVLFKPSAARKDVPSEILQHIAHPDWLLSRRQLARQPKGHLKPEAAMLLADGFLIVIERRIAKSYEMEMAYPAVGTLICADPINRVGAAEHMLDDGSPMLWFLSAVNLVQARSDRVPSRRRGVLMAVLTFVFGEVHGAHLEALRRKPMTVLGSKSGNL